MPKRPPVKYATPEAERRAREHRARLDNPPKQVIGDPRFHAVLDEMRALHDKKSADYGAGEDPLANVRASAEFGVPAWIGTMVRANDKMIRIKSMATKGTLENEPLEDSLIDLAAYAILGLVLYRDSKSK
jgi:hypothetical protein